MLDLRIFRDRLFRTSTLVVLPSSAGFLGLLYAFPQLQQEGLGRTATESGLLTFPEAIGVMVGSQIVSRLYRRVGPRRLISGGATTVALMALCLTQVDGATPDDWRDLASERGGEFAPTGLSDGKTVSFVPWEGGGGDPADHVDRAVAETRANVFPLLGLDPYAAQG
jgi:hypothetical protein